MQRSPFRRLLIIYHFVKLNDFMFKKKRDQLHNSIRLGVLSQVKEMLQEKDNQCVMLAMAKNERSRSCLHIAVLNQNEEIVKFLAENFPTTLNVVDNVRQIPYKFYELNTKYTEISQFVCLVKCRD